MYFSKAILPKIIIPIIFKNYFGEPADHKFVKDSIEKVKLTIDEIVNELKSIAFAPVDNSSIKARNKIRALELLGRYLGMFNDRDKAPKNSEINVQVLFVEKVGDRPPELINPDRLNLLSPSEN